MTLYAVVGNGEMPEKEVAQQLDDLWKKAEAEDTDFWFVLEGKAHPTATDLVLVDWLNKHDMYFALLQLPGVQPSEAYQGVAEFIDVDKPSDMAEVMEVMRAKPDENGGKTEDAVALALFCDIAADSPEDHELIVTLTATIGAGFKAYALNDALEEIELRTEEAVPLPEDAVKPKVEEPVAEAPTPEVEAEEADDAPLPLDKSYLDGLTAAELKEMCKGMGMAYPGTKAEAVAAILAHTAEPVGAEIVDKGITGTPISDEDDALFVEVDGEVYPTEDIVLPDPSIAPIVDAPPLPDFGKEEVTHAEAYDASFPPVPPLPDLEDPVTQEDIRTSLVTPDKVFAYEVQYSYLPKNAKGTYRTNRKTLIISSNIIRAVALVMMKHQDEDGQVHQIIQRSHRVMIDSAVLQ